MYYVSKPLEDSQQLILSTKRRTGSPHPCEDFLSGTPLYLTQCPFYRPSSSRLPPARIYDLANVRNETTPSSTSPPFSYFLASQPTSHTGALVLPPPPCPATLPTQPPCLAHRLSPPPRFPQPSARPPVLAGQMKPPCTLNPTPPCALCVDRVAEPRLARRGLRADAAFTHPHALGGRRGRPRPAVA